LFNSSKSFNLFNSSNSFNLFNSSNSFNLINSFNLFNAFTDQFTQSLAQPANSFRSSLFLQRGVRHAQVATLIHPKCSPWYDSNAVLANQLFSQAQRVLVGVETQKEIEGAISSRHGAECFQLLQRAKDNF